ncbi:MAG: aminotransferase class I/II-fold pyridoxal phosphate-dependent enzyme [Anaerolineales bacterium]|nr:aminotransferase class I/II-fold pyridoxal phosphate-dependent enzyme [Anaerolineales bacterium]
MPTLPNFKLERYFAQYEFKVRYLLSASDCEAVSVADLLALADADSRARWQRLSLGYTESQGDPALRAAIAATYTAVQPADVVVLVPEEGIYLAMRTLLEPGQHVIAIAPAYQSLSEIASAIGCAVSPWPVTLTPSGWALDLDQLEALVRPETRVLVINFPHNPTGLLPSRAFLDALLAFARRHDLIVFSDEMYRGLELDPAARLPAMADLYDRAVSLSGLSKSYAAPGLRLGWLATRLPGLVDRLVAYKDYTTICHSAPSEVLGLIALRAGQHLLDRNLALIRANAALAAAFFAQHPALFRWLPPQAGSIAFPQYLGPEPVDAFCQSVLDAEGLLIVPGRLFNTAGPHFRVGLGRANFPQALEHLDAYLARR